MDQEKIIIMLKIHRRNEEYDVEIPTDITANELIVGLNEAFRLGMDTSDTSRNCLKAENPIALLRGNKLVREYGLHTGSIINYTD